MMLITGALLSLALAIWPAAASADPVSTAIATYLVAAGVGAVTASYLASAILLALAVGASLLLQTLTKQKPKIQQTGLQTEFTSAGEGEPQSFILGRYATGGHFLCPPMSHSSDNGFLTYVIEVSSLPRVTLEKVIIGDDYSSIDYGSPHAEYGYPLTGQRYNGFDYAWIKFYDGTQTAADPMLLDKYGNYADRPWTADHIGTGVAYAILTFRFSRTIYNGLPKVRFVIGGIPLYDPRKDSTVGGSGSHRWDDPDTWETTRNPVVMAYNIMRGITFPDGNIYGGKVDADGLPFANVVAGMNVCDTLIGDRVQFEAGFEVKVDMEPTDVIDELMKTCLGQPSEFGGVFRFRIGPPGTPVLSITDDDVLISEARTFRPFPGEDSTFNAITAQYVEPSALWETREAEPIYNITWEGEDGGRRLPISMTFPAVSNNSQVQQLIAAYIADHRRFRIHSIVLPPFAAILEPLDTISWTSSRNGYSAKVFEVGQLVDNPFSLNQQIEVRERDPLDYSWSSVQDLPAPTGHNSNPYPPAQAVEAWSVTGTTITDSSFNNRRPALLLEWSGTAAADAELVRWEIRLSSSGAAVASGTADATAGNVIITQGILPAENYEARGRYIMSRPSAWSAWLSATTPDVPLTEIDLDATVRDQLSSIAEREAEAVVRHEQTLADAQALVDDLETLLQPQISTSEQRAAEAVSRHAATLAAAQVQVDTLETNLQSELSTASERAAEAVARHAATLADAQVRIDFLRDALRPDQQSLGDRLDDLAGIVTYGLQRLQQTDGRLADAGMVIDPATGRAYISGVLATENLISDVRIDLDAANAEIALRATVAEVNAAISAAVLDPSQIPIIDDLELRITATEITLDANAAAIALKADEVTVNGIDARLSTAEIDIDANATAIALKASQTEVDNIESRLTDAEIEISAIDGASIRQTVIDTRKTADDIDAASFTSLQQMWEAWKSRDGLRTEMAFGQSEILAVVNDGLSAEAAARLGLAVLVDGNTADIVSEQRVRADADSALASDISGLQASLATTDGNVTANAGAITAIDVRVTIAEGQLVSQASDITSLEVGLASVEGDVLTNASAISGLDARVTIEEGVSTSQTSSIISLRATVNDAESATDQAAFTSLQEFWASWKARDNLRSEVAFAQSEILAVVHEGLFAEAAARLTLGVSVEAAAAALVEEQSVRVDADNALASDIVSLQASLADTDGDVAANASAISAIDIRVTATEGALTSQASQIISLDADLTSAEGDIAANAGALSALDTRVTSAEGSITSQASDITGLTSALSSTDGDVAANAAAISGLDTRVTVAEGAITSQASDLVSLQSDLTAAESGIAANAGAITVLDTRVTATEGVTTSQASSLLVLRASLNDVEDEVDAAAATGLEQLWASWEARESLRNEIAFAQSEILAVVTDGLSAEAAARLNLGVSVAGNAASLASEQVARAAADSALASDITALQAGLVSTDGSLAATADALSGLDARVVAAEGELVSQASSLVSLETSLSTAEGEITATADAVTALDGRVTVAEGSLTSQAADITTLEAEIAAALDDIASNTAAIGGNAAAVTALDARVTTAEGSITSQASDISDLQADLAAVDGSVTANAGAISSLDARVTASEGDITATASDLTKLSVRLTETSNLIPNGQLVSADYWTFGAGWALNTPAGVALGQRSVGVASYTYAGGSGFSPAAQSDAFAVVASASYTVAGQIRRSGASGQFAARCSVQWQTSSGSVLSTSVVWSTSVTATTFQRFASTMIAPSGAHKARVLFDVDLGNTSASGVVAGPEMLRIGDAMLTAQADITTLQSVKVDAAGAVAAVDSAVSAQYGSLSAMAVATQFAEATATDVAAGFILRAGSGPSAGTLEIVSGGNLGGSASTIRLAADNVRIVGAAQIDDAVITSAKIADAAITSAKIGSASIDTLKLAGNAVTIPISDSGGGIAQGDTRALPSFTTSEAAPMWAIISFDSGLTVAEPTVDGGIVGVGHYVDGILRGSGTGRFGLTSTFVSFVPSLPAGSHTHYLKTEVALDAELEDWVFFGQITKR